MDSTKRFLTRLKRIDQFCERDCKPPEDFILILDQHEQRPELITRVSQAMYGGDEPRRHLIEPLFQVESHRYQTMQAAVGSLDWWGVWELTGPTQPLTLKIRYSFGTSRSALSELPAGVVYASGGQHGCVSKVVEIEGGVISG